jgi:predicted Zn-dependent peptidase
MEKYYTKNGGIVLVGTTIDQEDLEAAKKELREMKEDAIEKVAKEEEQRKRLEAERRKDQKLEFEC